MSHLKSIDRPFYTLFTGMNKCWFKLENIASDSEERRKFRKKNKRIVLHGYGFLQEKGKGKEVGGTGLGRRHIGITQKYLTWRKKLV